jgi:hypothetical protein
MRTVGNFVSLLFLLLVVSIVILAGGAMVMGMGWGLSQVFPVTVFQGSAIIAAVGLMLVIYTSLVQVQDSLRDIRNCLAPPRWEWLEDEEDEDEEYEEEEWDEETDENGDAFDKGREVPFASPVEVRRNDPCPCGSGRKYKNCCGRGEMN